MYQLSPSILAADFNCLGEQIRQVEEAGVEYPGEKWYKSSSY